MIICAAVAAGACGAALGSQAPKAAGAIMARKEASYAAWDAAQEAALSRFREENGGAMPSRKRPGDEAACAVWVDDQRRRAAAGAMSREEAERMASLGVLAPEAVDAACAHWRPPAGRGFGPARAYALSCGAAWAALAAACAAGRMGPQAPVAACALALALALLSAAWSACDVRDRCLPAELALAAWALGAAYQAALGELPLALAVGAGAWAVSAAVARLTRHLGLSAGDPRMLGACACACGPDGLLAGTAAMLAAIGCQAVARKTAGKPARGVGNGAEYPLGPGLAAMAAAGTLAAGVLA